MTIDIRGKTYVTVDERVRMAHEAGDFEMVSSELFTLEGTGRWWYRATISVDGKVYIGTAEVKFNAKAGTPDAQNPVECAETSAVGRALGFAGKGVVESIASADELTRGEPQAQQAEQKRPQQAPQASQPPQRISPTGPDTGGANEQQLTAIAHLCQSLGRSVPEVKSYGHARTLITSLTNEWQAQKREAKGA